ncbi:hypothetical protein AXF42_Ash000390 [Apostasia shenzhenica]|uniref:Protein phosphatase 1 regulatory subunit 11 n=1 Tax=Apostasia shenzhenica TaxID=1088818 RepID=A0A2I0AGB1_9ASPA|nr:hypothetical protein AXF42_Ash000390 [Apostasia shenzhenica]
MARTATRSPASPSGSATVTLEETPSSSFQQQTTQTLVLRLKRPKKKVTWKEGTVDNEKLGRKSSKKCCIYHKQKPFDEDDSDEEDCHGSDGGAFKPEGNRGGCCSHGEGDHSI